MLLPATSSLAALVCHLRRTGAPQRAPVPSPSLLGTPGVSKLSKPSAILLSKLCSHSSLSACSKPIIGDPSSPARLRSFLQLDCRVVQSFCWCCSAARALPHTPSLPHAAQSIDIKVLRMYFTVQAVQMQPSTAKRHVIRRRWRCRSGSKLVWLVALWRPGSCGSRLAWVEVGTVHVEPCTYGSAVVLRLHDRSGWSCKAQGSPACAMLE